MSVTCSADYPEIHRDNVDEYIEKHGSMWNQDKGGAWWIEDFMACYGVWWGDFQQDLKRVIKAAPIDKINDHDEVKKFLIGYMRPKLHRLSKTKKAAIDAEKNKPTRIVKPVATANDDVEKIIKNAESKNQAMSQLREMGFANKQIADYMKLKPGRVASGIRAYDMKKKEKAPTHNLW